MTSENSRVVLGTVQFGMDYGIANALGKVNPTEVASMLDLAARFNIRYLDTAISYGESESLLGKYSKQRFSVITKLPSVPKSCDDVEKWVEEELYKSLVRLSANKIYGVLLHSPLDLLGSHGKSLSKALIKCKKKGYVEKIGVSVYTPNEIERVCRVMHPDILQAPLNVLDRRLETSGCLESLNAKGVEVHVRSLFLQGLLLMNVESIPKKFFPWFEVFHQWREWLIRNRVTALEACIQFALGVQGVDKIVVGALNTDQLKQIAVIANTNSHLEVPTFNGFDERLINPSVWNSL